LLPVKSYKLHAKLYYPLKKREKISTTWKNQNKVTSKCLSKIQTSEGEKIKADRESPNSIPIQRVYSISEV
jgi:hypothetical protein